jgi:formylglycine-generating enzyme required for sulfatase activity
MRPYRAPVVLRGGAWFDSRFVVRCAAPDAFAPGQRDRRVGLRPVSKVKKGKP